MVNEKTELSDDARALLEDVVDMDGYEVPERAWESAEIVELLDKGLVAWSPESARGPGRAWKRLLATKKGEAERAAA